jgi:hypothetical protein
LSCSEAPIQLIRNFLVSINPDVFSDLQHSLFNVIVNGRKHIVAMGLVGDFFFLLLETSGLKLIVFNLKFILMFTLAVVVL